MAEAIEEIGIAEGNVLRASGDLLANVLHDDVAADDAKNAFVNGDDGAMAAEMLAAAAGFGGTDEARCGAGDVEMGVLGDRREVGAIRSFEDEAF